MILFFITLLVILITIILLVIASTKSIRLSKQKGLFDKDLYLRVLLSVVLNIKLPHPIPK